MCSIVLQVHAYLLYLHPSATRGILMLYSQQHHVTQQHTTKDQYRGQPVTTGGGATPAHLQARRMALWGLALMYTTRLFRVETLGAVKAEPDAPRCTVLHKPRS